MSAILGVFSPAGSPLPDVAVRRMLAPMAARGGERTEIWRDGGTLLAVSRPEWQTGDDFAGRTLIAHDERTVVAADASLYYRTELRQRLAASGIRCAGESVADLILSAYGAWGERCPTELDGDYAFIVWDRAERRVLCARDFVGTRPLYFAQAGAALVVASGIGAVLAHPDCSRELNWLAVADQVARYFAATHETGYRDVEMLLAGAALSWTAGRVPHVERFWEAPDIRESKQPRFEEAAEELRALLIRSVAERSSDRDGSAVWLSGGYDSSALFAAGQTRLHAAGTPDRLHAVSMTYPSGDPGREDDLIESIAARWRRPVHWVDSSAIPVLPGEPRISREEIFAHPFEHWHRQLARASVEAGARVALSGIGGDELFAGSDVFLVDLVRQFRWLRLASEWRTRVHRYGVRFLVTEAVIPALPHAAKRAVERLRGRPFKDRYEIYPPAWMAPSFVAEHQLAEREFRHRPTRDHPTRSAEMMYHCLMYPAFPLIRASFAGSVLEEGIEVRIPLYDRRIIELAVRRPQPERLSGAESKRLLRRSMAGLLPDHVLAPRRKRTGTTGGYFDRWVRRQRPAWVDGVIDDMLLARHGIVDQAAIRRAWAEFLTTGHNGQGTQLYATIQTELWLRAQLAAGHAESGNESRAPHLAVAHSAVA